MSMMHTWFECKVRYEKTLENGSEKNITEIYLVDALNFTEAENRIIEEMKPFIKGEFTVADIKRANYSELFEDDAEDADKWYKCKVMFTTIDEKNGKEKKTASNILVQAGSLRESLNKLEEGMKGTMSDWEVTSITETTIMDVYPYKADGEDEQTKALKGDAKVAITAGDVKTGTSVREFNEACKNMKNSDPLLGKVIDYLKEKKSIGRTEFGIAFHLGVKRVAKIVAQLVYRGLISKDCKHVLTYTGGE